MTFKATPAKLLKRFRQAPHIVQVLLCQHFFEGFIPIMALYAIMFERVGGLNFRQIGFLFSIWTLAFLVVEVPSGVFADYWSRKKIIMTGGVLRAIGFALWIVSPNFWGYAVGFALWGAAIACSSGAVSAYLHNELRALNKEEKFSKYYGWTMSTYYLGTLLGYGIAAVLTLKHTNTLISLSIASSLLLSFSLLSAKENPYPKQDTYFKTLKNGLEEILKSKKLRYVCYGLFTADMIIGVLEELLPRLYANFGFNDTAVSLILAFALLATVIILARLESVVHFSLSKQVLAMALATGLLITGLVVGGITGSALLLLFSLTFQLMRSLFQYHVQNTATSAQRATIASIPGLFGGLVGTGAYYILGKGAALSSERFSIGAYAFFWLIILLVLAFLGRQYNVPIPKRTPIIQPSDTIIP